MLEHLNSVKKIMPWVMVVLAAVLGLAIIFGGLFFDLDTALVVSWFGSVIILVFALAFFYAVISFIGWFLFSRPFVMAFVAGAFVVIVLIAVIFINLIGGPVIDLGSILQPIVAFLNF